MSSLPPLDLLDSIYQPSRPQATAAIPPCELCVTPPTASYCETLAAYGYRCESGECETFEAYGYQCEPSEEELREARRDADEADRIEAES